MTISVRLTPHDVISYLESSERDPLLKEHLKVALYRSREDATLTSYLNEGGIRIAMHAAGVSVRMLDDIMSCHRARATHLLTHDPFSIIGTVKGFDFPKAAAIWRRLGPARSGTTEYAKAIIKHLMSESRSKGDIWVEKEHLVRQINERALLERSSIESAFDELIQTRQIIAHQDGSLTKLIHLDSIVVERDIAASVLSRIRTVNRIDAFDVLEASAGTHAQALDPEQVTAVETAVNEQISLITGGPGTGKSTILQVAASLFLKINPNARLQLVSLAARVARSVGSKTGIPANTIHAALGSEPGYGYFYGLHRKLPVDVLFVEEAFMVGNSLFADLLAAVPDHAQIVIVGDSQQLPPVMEGKPLEAILESRMVPTVELKTNHRSTSRDIPAVGKRVMEGLPVNSSDNVIVHSVSTVIEAISLVEREFAQARSIPDQSVQILTAMHDGSLGTHLINRAISGRDHIAVGDLVMQTVNDRDRSIYNGEIGTVVRHNGHTLTIERDDGALIEYDLLQQKDLTKAWAITYHKSQGLEYDTVILIVSRQHKRMLGRNLINVGITRAKRRCVIIDQGRALDEALKRDQTQSRTTMLTKLLHGEKIG